MKTYSVRLVALLFVLVLSTACAQSSGDSGEESGAARVALENIKFQPRDLELSVGDSLTWTNEDTVEHTVTSGRPQEQGVPGVSENTDAMPDGLFDHAMPPGETFSFTFDEAGTYEYFCNIHPGMTATLSVDR